MCFKNLYFLVCVFVTLIFLRTKEGKNMKMKENDLDRIVKIVQADKKQFELLYSQIFNKVYFWCYTIMGNKQDAEIACQESISNIYFKIDTLKNTETINAWIYKITTSVCYSQLRNKKKEVIINPDMDANHLSY